MKLLLQTFVLLLFLLSSLSQAEKFPSGIPSSIDGNILFATIIDSPDLKTTHSDLNKEDLVELDDYLVVDQKTVPNSIKTSEVIAQLQKETREDGPIALCFRPRHYISYQSTYGQVSLAICYECSRVLVNIEGWYKTLSLQKKSADELNSFYKSINLEKPRFYQKSLKRHQSLLHLRLSDRAIQRATPWR